MLHRREKRQASAKRVLEEVVGEEMWAKQMLMAGRWCQACEGAAPCF